MNKRLFLPLILLLALFAGCKNNEDDLDEPIVEQDVEMLYHEISNLNCIKELFASGQQICFGDSLFRFNTPNQSVLITSDTASSADTAFIFLDFGSMPALCNDGKFRSGLVEYAYNKNFSYADSSVLIQVKMVNYRVDTLLINGIQFITNNGRVDDTLRWDIVSNLFITTNQGKTITSNGTYSMKLQNTSFAFTSFQTPISFDFARFRLSGTSYGVNIEGRNYYTNLDPNVEFGFDCIADSMAATNCPFTSGQVYYQSGSYVSTRKCLIDFGMGACDRTYILRCNGYTVTSKFR